MIGLWLSKQGSICPLTGQPLVEAELTTDGEAKAEAKAWNKDLLAKRKQAAAGGGGAISTAGSRTKEARGRGGPGSAPGGQAGKQQAGPSTAKASSPSSSSRPTGADTGTTAGRSRSNDADRLGAVAAPAKGASGERRGSKGADNDDIYEF